MKYYKINITTLYDNNRRFRSEADGKLIPNANDYFYAMREGKIILDAPVFDHFILRNYDESQFKDTHLLDVHSFIGEGSQILGWFVSGDLRLLLENFNLAQPHHFYSSKLMYKGNKLDYYIFQYDGESILNKIKTKYFNWTKSIFVDPIDESNLSINSPSEFINEYRRIRKISEYGVRVKLKKIVLTEFIDFITMRAFTYENIVSERLKQAMEEKGITGLEFSELDYEVVVEK